MNASTPFTASLPRQLDEVIHFDQSRALEPLERWSRHLTVRHVRSAA
jgi:hypothetical protein